MMKGPVQGSSIEAKDVDQEVVLFASVLISAESWKLLAEGDILVARNGRLAIPETLG